MKRSRRVAKGTFVVSDSESEDELPAPSYHRHVHLDADATGYSARTATFIEAPGSPSKKASSAACETVDVEMSDLPDLIPLEDDSDDEYDRDLGLPHRFMEPDSQEAKKRARTASVSACVFP